MHSVRKIGMEDFSVNQPLPLPSLKPTTAAQVVYSRHQIPGEHAGNATASMEYTGAFGELVFPVP